MDLVKWKAEGDGVVHVLVEEEAAVRAEWLRIAKCKGYAVMTYPDAEWFLSDLANNVFRGNERFYLDQDMEGVRGVGVRLARTLKTRWPGAFVCLVTAYPKLLFRRELAEGVLNDVFGKYPSPFNNPPFTEWEQRYEREVWTPLLAQLGGYN